MYLDLRHFSALFQWMILLLHWEESIGVLEHHFLILACSQLSSTPYSTISLPDLGYYCRCYCMEFGCTIWRAGF